MNADTIEITIDTFEMIIDKMKKPANEVKTIITAYSAAL